MKPGKLTEGFAFDAPSDNPDGHGGIETGWDEQFTRRCEVIYQRGSEAVEAARLSGKSIYKLRLRSDTKTRTITTDWRARDARRGTEYNIREADAITDRAWVYLVIESGVAV